MCQNGSMPHGHDCVEAEDLGESAEHRVEHALFCRERLEETCAASLSR